MSALNRIAALAKIGYNSPVFEFRQNKTSLFVLPSVLSFIAYLTTLCPTLYTGDSGELSLAAYTLGIAHPPGYPLLLLIGKAFLIFSSKNTAFTLNILNALFSSMAAGVTSILIYYILFPADQRGKYEAILVSIMGGLLFAFANTLWAASGGFEVYSLSILLICLSLLLLFENCETGRFQFLAAAVFFFGLSLVNHLSALAVAPAVLYVISKSRSSAKKAAILASLFFLPLLLYVYIPLRSSQNPLADWNHPAAFSAFIDHLTARRYQAYVTGIGFENLFQNILRSMRILLRQFPFYLSIPGFAGLILPSTFKKDIRFILLSVLIVNLVLSGLYDIPDIDQYYLPSVLILTVGFLAFLSLIVKRLKDKIKPVAKIGLVILAAFIAFTGNYSKNNQSQNRLAYIYGHDILKSIPQNSFVISVGDNSNSSLYYLRYVENKRRDLEIFDPVITVDSLMRFLKDMGLNGDNSGSGLCLELAKAYPQKTYIVKEHMLARGNPFQYWNMGLYPRGMVYGFSEGKSDTTIWNDLEIPSFDKLARNMDFKGMTMLVNLHLCLGEDYYEAHDTRGAVEQYRKAREIAESSGEASVHNSLGIFFRRQGWPVLARNEYESALKAEHITADEKSNIYVNLGNLEKDRRQFDKAIDFYKKALAIKRNNTDGQYNYTLVMAYESLESKNYSNAAGYFESALRMPDSDPLINFNLGVLYDRSLNDESRAIYYYKKLIETVPGSREAGIARQRLLELEKNR